MTNYTAHADATFDPDKPTLGSTHLESRDNLLAAMDGGLNAPRLSASASAGSVVGGTLLWSSMSDSLSASVDTTVLIPSSVFRAVASGNIRYTATISAASGSGQVYVYKQTRGATPVLLGTVTVTTALDLAVAAGDVVYIKLRAGISGASGSVSAYAEVFTGTYRVNGGG